MQEINENEKYIERGECYLTQDKFLKKCIEKELEELEIDISSNDYYKDEKFKMLEKEFVFAGIWIPKSWWIEKNIVGQERLKEIYGIYAMGVKHEYSQSELQNSAWMNELAEKYRDAKMKTKGEFIRLPKYIEQYFFRKKTENSSGAGLVERLKSVGFDIDKFEYPKEKIEKIKLLYFLFCFEFDNKVKIQPFLSNPTLENVDNTFVGDETRNGELMACLKNNLLKEIDPDYVSILKKCLDDIISQWERQIIYVRYLAFAGKDIDYLKEINDDLEWILSKIGKSPILYEDSLLETFYLKLSLHEVIGRENDLLDVSGKHLEELSGPNEYQLKKYKEIDEEELEINWEGEEQYKTIFDYINGHKRMLAQCVFGKDDINSNDYKKLARANDGLREYLNFLKENTKASFIERIPVLFVISCLQEIILIDKKEKIENTFYRHEAKDIRTLNSEIFHGKEALRKNQYAWIAKVMRRYNANRGNSEVSMWERKIEDNLDFLLLEVYKSNSLREMNFTAWLILSYIKIFIEKREIVSARQDALVEVLQKEKYCLNIEDERMLRTMLGFLVDSQFIDFVNVLLKDVVEAETTDKVYLSEFDYKIAADTFAIKKDMHLEIGIIPKEKTIEVLRLEMNI